MLPRVGTSFTEGSGLVSSSKRKCGPLLSPACELICSAVNAVDWNNDEQRDNEHPVFALLNVTKAANFVNKKFSSY